MTSLSIVLEAAMTSENREMPLTARRQGISVSRRITMPVAKLSTLTLASLGAGLVRREEVLCLA